MYIAQILCNKKLLRTNNYLLYTQFVISKIGIDEMCAYKKAQIVR